MNRVTFESTFWSGFRHLMSGKRRLNVDGMVRSRQSDLCVGHDSANGFGACDQLADDGLFLASRGERGFVALSLWMQGKR
jgi:hypothetical protein